MDDVSFEKNNLDRAASPYLRQHGGNPIWWQEWNNKTLAYAQRTGKIIFVSVGYATCHWCHVMAEEAFSDPESASYLNEHFVSIKVDREQRPAIDQYLMAVVTALGKNGGWPLNCFLTPTLKPLYAFTYAGSVGQYGMPGFREILQQVQERYAVHQEGNDDVISLQQMPSQEYEEPMLAETLWDHYDGACGGFGYGVKFPPHCTLLFMVYYYAATQNERLKEMAIHLLDTMLMSGLHDHLQGGFFRYCMDRQWTIPHFEKMIYDQALLLWVYSLGYGVFGDEAYRITARKIMQCLTDTFEKDGLFFSGHDADTEHTEGATYLWDDRELQQRLSPDEYWIFTEVYAVSPEGNFGGKNHLLKKKKKFLPALEKKLLTIRKGRPQPFIDRKIITAWNALVGIGFIHAYRYCNDNKALAKARRLADSLLERHYCAGKLARSSFEEDVQTEEFLQDYAALLLFLTYLYEETGGYEKEMDTLAERLSSFRRGTNWVESFNQDFFPVTAETFDHPIPGSISLAEMALVRMCILRGGAYAPSPYHLPLHNDFRNIVSLITNGLFHIVETPEKCEWNTMPVNSMQLKGARFQDCFKGACRPIGTA